MAEAWFNQLATDDVHVVSAGSDPAGYVHPTAIAVMAEVGLDLSKNDSKSLSQFLNHEFDFVITVCDDAAESCPVFPGPGERIHWSLEDPAKFVGSDEEAMEVFRTTRELIRRRVTEFLETHPNIIS